MFLQQRSYQKELLDNDDVPFPQIRQNMKELNIINTWLGGHDITLAGLKKIIGTRSKPHWTICEIGCGGGDNLRAIEHWCHKNNLSASFIGIDKKTSCIDYASSVISSSAYQWIPSDYRDARFGDQKPDIIFSSLFCHHFSHDELLQMMGWMRANSREGFFINDLHRHPVAWLGIAILTRLFSASDMVKHDAPLSVARGFKRKEWIHIMQEADMPNFVIQWKWAFRWLVTVQ